MSRVSFIAVAAALALSFGSLQPSLAAVLIPISGGGVTSNAPNNLNTPAKIVSDAQGDYNYAAPPPGGGVDSWHTNQAGGPNFGPVHNVRVTFNFNSIAGVDELVLWDYYSHSPTQWTVKLFSGLNATGSELLSYDFSISPVLNFFSTRWVIDLADTLNVSSAQLLTRVASQNGGVGLAEVAFVQAAVPQPTSGLVFFVGCFAVACCSWLRRRNSAAFSL